MFPTRLLPPNCACQMTWYFDLWDFSRSSLHWKMLNEHLVKEYLVIETSWFKKTFFNQEMLPSLGWKLLFWFLFFFLSHKICLLCDFVAFQKKKKKITLATGPHVARQTFLRNNVSRGFKQKTEVSVRESPKDTNHCHSGKTCCLVLGFSWAENEWFSWSSKTVSCL